jgi:BASS family bile acid:Na+ symporter
MATTPDHPVLAESSGKPRLKDFGFTFCVAAAVAGAVIFPSVFLHWGPIDLRNKWIFLFVIQLVMFAMGTQMTIDDFFGVARAPKGVGIGLLCHYTVMPLVGLALAKLFHFPPEVAAGIVLVGSCSSGLASNVMAYIAGSNLALSVTVTALSTLFAPLCTPLLMKWLAGTFVTVDLSNMASEIVKMVLVPIGGALLHDALKGPRRRGAIRLAIVGLVAAVLAYGLGYHLTGGFLAEAVLAGLIYNVLWRLQPRWDVWMPRLAMAGILYATSVTVAAGRDNLLKIGFALIMAEALHNGAGYGLGYGLSRVFGLDKNSARSVAFEVGMQNGGMAAGLASAMGKLSTVGLGAAVFSPIMNVSGSLLANYWKRRPVKE